MASLDTRRPAAQEQLRVLGEQAGVDTLPIVAGQTPQQITRRAMEAARLGGYDVVMLDTAGRLHIDEELMHETVEVRDIAQPHETLLVADSLTGQDAVNLAKTFNERVGITGIVLTRVDGDGRGGAALSMRAVTGKPIKLIGVGEKWDALEDFHPERIAGRILGMGDVVSLVEKAAQTIDMEKAQAIAQKMRKGEFDLEDLSDQLKQMQKIGGMSSMMGMLPGIGKIKKQIDAANLDDHILKRQRAIISSMTPKERRSPKILDGKRKRRIAAGSGTKPEEINKLLKMHRQMADMMKMMGKRGGLMQRMMGGMGGGGGAAPSAAELEKMQAELARLDPKALESLPRELKEQLPGGLPGLGGGGRPMPRLPGLPGGAPPFRACPACQGRRSEHVSRHTHAGDRAAAPARLARGGSRLVRRVLRQRSDGALCRWRLQPRRRLAPHGWPDRPLGTARVRQLGDRGEGSRELGWLQRPVDSRRLARARAEVGPGCPCAWAWLCHGGRAPRARVCLSRARLVHAGQLHRAR